MTHKIILSDSAYSTMVDNFFAMKNRAEAAEEQLTGAAATIVTLTADVTRLSCERDEWIDAYRKQEIAYSASINDASEVRAKRDAAWSELRKIREEIGARIDESTYDEVASFKRQYERVHAERDEEHQKGVTLAKWLATATKERDEAQRTVTAQAQQLRTACNEVTDDVTRLSWLQSLITSCTQNIEVVSGGDISAGLMCIGEVQALHDALKAMLNGDNDKPLDEWEQAHEFLGILGNWRKP